MILYDDFDDLLNPLGVSPSTTKITLSHLVTATSFLCNRIYCLGNICANRDKQLTYGTEDRSVQWLFPSWQYHVMCQYDVVLTIILTTVYQDYSNSSHINSWCSKLSSPASGSVWFYFCTNRQSNSERSFSLFGLMFLLCSASLSKLYQETSRINTQRNKEQWPIFTHIFPAGIIRLSKLIRDDVLSFSS